MACYYEQNESLDLPMPVYVIANVGEPKFPMLAYYGGPLMGWVPRVDDAFGFASWDEADRVREVVGGMTVLRVYGVDFSDVRYRR